MAAARPSTPLRQWVIGLDPWIVQDGNYGEFAVDEVCRGREDGAGLPRLPSCRPTEGL